MKYRIYVDESKARKDGQMPVQLIFEEKGSRFKMSTGLFSSVKFSGREFPETEQNHRVKTIALARKLMKVDEYLLMNECASFKTAKNDIKCILYGEEHTTKPLWSIVEDYAKGCERENTRRIYLQAARKVRGFDPQATFSSVDKDWIEKFDMWMLNNGLRHANSRISCMGSLKTIFNKAIDEGITNNYPFRRYRIKSEKTTINNISVGQLRELRDCKITGKVQIYRDLFLLSFYLCGINPVDMLHLTKENIKNGRIVYRRRKTGKLYNIPLVEEAKVIFDRYRGESYLLNVMEKKHSYRTFLLNWDKRLKSLGYADECHDSLGRKRKSVLNPIIPNATVYSARYTFASIGAELEIPRETIALCLGHSWADVTSHYIAYDLKRIDDAVRKIIDYVNEK